MDRDPSTINKTCLASVLQADTMEAAVAMRNAFLLARGLDYDALDDATRAMVAGRLIVGDADSVGEQVRAIIDLGLDGVCMNLPGNGHDPEATAATVANVLAAVG
jgi:alkanesulfonate monooxygenase SsuD/methylene tetrahydromethanopterin reductase-like flavin-dependent oxidoreductase (luciferase family)